MKSLAAQGSLHILIFDDVQLQKEGRKTPRRLPLLKDPNTAENEQLCKVAMLKQGPNLSSLNLNQSLIRGCVHTSIFFASRLLHILN